MTSQELRTLLAGGMDAPGIAEAIVTRVDTTTDAGALARVFAVVTGVGALTPSAAGALGRALGSLATAGTREIAELEAKLRAAKERLEARRAASGVSALIAERRAIEARIVEERTATDRTEAEIRDHLQAIRDLQDALQAVTS